VTRAESTKPFDTHQKGDAIVSDDPERSVSVRIADCVPILLASDDGRIVAAVHAGWRGVIAGVVPAAIDVMRQTRAGAAGLIAAVGPCISEDAFEVGPDVLAEFTRVFGAAAPARSTADGKGRVDLRAAVMIQLIAAGIPADQIDVTDRCTVRDRDEFYSHRRDNGLTGRMAAVIAANG
jgi:hypothetical protein